MVPLKLGQCFRLELFMMDPSDVSLKILVIVLRYVVKVGPVSQQALGNR